MLVSAQSVALADDRLDRIGEFDTDIERPTQTLLETLPNRFFLKFTEVRSLCQEAPFVRRGCDPARFQHPGMEESRPKIFRIFELGISRIEHELGE